ncbi:MAG: DUF973 family protein [Candidatus Bathyarchaeota archaeon]|nr:DUF973 family protein [Candidatus Termiticorpusculum sp.]
MSVTSAKTLAGIGSLLLCVPFVNIIGVILLLMGMNTLSKHYKDSRICDTGLIAASLLYIIGSILSTIGLMALSFHQSMVGLFLGFLLLIPIAIINFIFTLIAAVFFKNALHALAEQTGENIFRTAGTLMLISAILTIVLIGSFLMIITYIITAIAFFTLKNKPPKQSTYNYTQQQTTTENTFTKFCPHCGTPLPSDASYCLNCGKQT